MTRFLWLGTALFFLVVFSGCGDTFRPIIIPNPPQFPNPKAAHTVVTISDNGTAVNGSAMVIDVSGDSEVSVKDMGVRPVHAVQQSATQVLVVNQTVPALPQDSVSKLDFAGTVIGSTSTISLPPSFDSSGNQVSAAPNFVATTESGQAYVLMPLYQPPNQNNIGGVVVPSVAVINTTQGSIVATIPVGTNPLAMAETPNGQKLYVANAGDGTVNAFNTSDRSARGVSGTFNAPIWLAARSDNQRVYVLNGNGAVSTLDITTTAGPDTVIDASLSAPGANYMVYDTVLNRLYIPQGQQPKITIADISQSIPSVMNGGPITITAVSPASRSAGDPCAGTTVQALTVASVTALPDGTRAYVGAFYEDTVDGTEYFCPQVTVINTSNNAIKTSIAVPGSPDATDPTSPYYAPICASTRFRMNMAAAGDSSRAYLATCDGGGVNIIDTSTDTYLQNSPAPDSARPPIPPSTQNPPQNPVFVIAGP